VFILINFISKFYLNIIQFIPVSNIINENVKMENCVVRSTYKKLLDSKPNNETLIAFL
jgi:hypothetical protein